jgi:hypothetical protein
MTAAAGPFRQPRDARLPRRAACALRGDRRGAGRGPLPRPARAGRDAGLGSGARAARFAEAAEFVFPSDLAPRVAAATGYAAASFSAGRPVLAGLLELMSRIRRDFTYQSGVTGRTPRWRRCWKGASASARTSRM